MAHDEPTRNPELVDVECPYCGAEMDSSDRLTTKEEAAEELLLTEGSVLMKPIPGCLSLCIYCGEYSKYERHGDGLTLVQLAPNELEQAPRRERKMLYRAQRIVKQFINDNPELKTRRKSKYRI